MTASGRRSHGAGVLAVLMAACGSDASTAEARDVCTTDLGTPPESPAAESYDGHRDERLAPVCSFRPGDSTLESIGDAAPQPPEDVRIVVLMLENRSFDHYLSGVPGTDYSTDRCNPDPLSPAGKSCQVLADDFCLSDTKHEWGASHIQYDNGLMDGFVATNNPTSADGELGSRAMLYYSADDLPFAHWLAENFAVSDRHFASVLGPTWPNRLFMLKGTACGHTQGGLDGSIAITTDCGARGDNIFTQLEDRGVSYRLYDASGVASVTVGLGVIRGELGEPLVWPPSIEDFERDAEANQLPAFSMVGASTGEVYNALGTGTPQNDDHPKTDVRRGQIFMHRIVKALKKNPETFARTILFITYDEGGGFYDHVVPPPSCPAGDEPGHTDYGYDRYGFRVPLIVVSPFVKSPGYVSHHITDHASLLRFVQHRYGLGALSKRDANAWPFLDMFDFDPGHVPVAPAISDDPPPEPTSCARQP